jgi:hypothetical protein
VGAERGGWKSFLIAQVGNGQLVPAETYGDRLFDSLVPDQDCITFDFGVCFVKDPVLSGDFKPGQRAVV